MREQCKLNLRCRTKEQLKLNRTIKDNKSHQGMEKNYIKRKTKYVVKCIKFTVSYTYLQDYHQIKCVNLLRSSLFLIFAHIGQI